MMNLPRAIPLTLLLAVLTAPMVPAQQEYDEFAAGDFGRVRFEENGVHIVRDPGGSPFSASEAPSEVASPNAPIFNGDELRTDHRQRVEIELAGGTLIRVDHETELVFRSLPEPFADNPDNAILKLGYGTLQISSELVGKGEFRIDTPDASIYLLGNGDFRIEVDDYGQTRVFSRRGVAEIEGDGGSVLIRGGLRTTAYAGSAPDEPESFNTFVLDGFDRWVDARNESQDTYVASDEQAYEQIPSEVRPYYRELSSHGRWVHVPEYGYTWYPYDVPAGWRPYSDGYWSHSTRGYFWVSNEPWGWAPYHYGRWNWVAGYGWCWAPGRVFGGAWVSWSWGRAHLGWAPLNYWNQPVWVRSVRYGYYDPRCWTFVAYNDFGRRGGRHHHRTVDDVIEDLDNTAVVTRPPRVGPRTIATETPRERRDREFLREPTTRVPVIRSGRRPSATFVDGERDLIQRGRGTRTRAVATPAGPSDSTASRGFRSSPAVKRTPASTTRRTDVRRAGTSTLSSRRTAGTAARDDSAGKRSVPDRGTASRRKTTAGRSSAPGRTDDPKATRPSRTTTPNPRASSRGDSTPTRARSTSREADKRRNLYERMSEPRTTRQPSASRSRTSGGSRAKSPSAGRGSSRSKPSASRSKPSASRSKPSASRSKPSASRSKPSASSSRQRSSGSDKSSSRGSGRENKGGRK